MEKEVWKGNEMEMRETRKCDDVSNVARSGSVESIIFQKSL
jgi:hypothetical protein